jgi:hypothetical protein
LRQVVAHEIGHVEKGTFDCALASRAGADIGLPQAERLGLLRDAAQIAKQKGIPLEDLKFPPGFLLKKPPK